ncbi:glycine-rich extracellular protein 1 isoform X2 [Hyperolius riggenbachi]|uniref:glycine-rich extracellular protein 1 isoform X2 n=1 Tax=Hyperolius riggenbachi TaxID=752182 RepID=UPI0035A30D97
MSAVELSTLLGIRPQQAAAGNPIYQPEYVRGAGAQQPGPLGAKAGGKYKHPSQGYQQGPSGLQNGYGGLGVKPGKLGSGQYPQSGKQKPGYGNGAGNLLGNVLGQGLGTKPSKAGYGAGGYPNVGAQGGYGAGGYPNVAAQGGYGAGGYPNVAAQGGYGAGSYPQYGAQNGYGSPNYGQYGEQPGYGAANYPQYGVQPGYGNGGGLYPSSFQQPGYGAKPSKPAGYRNGYGGYPNNFQQQQGQGKAPKAGYRNGAGIYPSAAGIQGGIGKPSKLGSGYPSNLYPQGIGAKAPKTGYQQPYGNGLANYQGNGKGKKSSPLGAYQGPLGENSKLGAYGQQPYRSQPDALGYDQKSAKSGAKAQYSPQLGYPDSSKYAGAGQNPFTGQAVPQGSLEEEISPSASVEGTQSMGEGDSLPQITPTWPSVLRPNSYKGPEESAYTQNGYYGNSYRGCGGKC